MFCRILFKHLIVRNNEHRINVPESKQNRMIPFSFKYSSELPTVSSLRAVGVATATNHNDYETPRRRAETNQRTHKSDDDDNDDAQSGMADGDDSAGVAPRLRQQ